MPCAHWPSRLTARSHARADIGPRKRPQEPPPVAARSLTLADPRVEQPSLTREYLAPSFATAKKGESEALEVLAHILGTGSNSRLYRALVVEKGVAINAGAWYQSTALDPSKFGVYGSPRPGVTLPQLETEIDAVVAEVIGKGVAAEELERAKTRLIADSVYARDNQASLARWYGGALTTGATVEDVQRWPDRIKAVTAAEVQDAARKWLDKRRSVTGYLDQGSPAAGGEAFMIRRFVIGTAAAALALVASVAAHAMTIERIVSPAGIEAWLVQDKSVPLVALQYSFHGGASQDSAEKLGTASLAANMVDEGAGDLDSKTFHERMENHAIELNFSVSRDYFNGSLRTLTEHRDEAFDLLRLALTAPRFEFRCAGARARSGAVRLAPRHRQPERPRQQALVADGVSRPSLWP